MDKPVGKIATWRRATRCAAAGTCVEAAGTGGPVLVRDSADTAAGALTVPPVAWRALLARVRERP